MTQVPLVVVRCKQQGVVELDEAPGQCRGHDRQLGGQGDTQANPAQGGAQADAHQAPRGHLTCSRHASVHSARKHKPPRKMQR